MPRQYANGRVFKKSPILKVKQTEVASVPVYETAIFLAKAEACRTPPGEGRNTEGSGLSFSENAFKNF